jgi:hypothetical protein
MAGMEGLGRLYNLLPTGDGVYVSLKQATGVAFLCVGANAETFTLAEAKDAAGTGAQNLATITRYYSNSAAAAATAWVKEAIAAGAVVTTTTAKPVAVIEIQADELSDDYSYVKVTSSSTGTVVGILHDLNVQRAPANLVAPGV